MRKSGLLFMALGIVLAVIYSFVGSFVYSSVSHFDIALFAEVILPAIFVTGMTLVHRLFGSLLGAVASVIAMIFLVGLSVSSTKETIPDFFWWAITICYLLGSAFILSSLAIHAPHRENANA